MNERIKLVYQHSKMTQTAFANKIGISRTALQKLQSGENNPSEQTIRAICREFSIRRQWLEEGVEPMFVPEAEDDQIIEEAFAQRSDFVKAMFRAITKTPGGWELMEQLAENIAKEMQTKKDPVE